MSAQPALSRHKLRVEELHKMLEAGILGPSDRLELLDGELFDMAPIGPPHSGRTNKLAQLLSLAVGKSAIVSVQNPVVLGEFSEPQPDIALLRWREDFYANGHPRPQDVLLVVEVADSTAQSDREYKMPLYARHGIPEAWLLDIAKQQLEIHRQPEAGCYRQILLPKNDERVPLPGMPGAFVEAREIW